MIRSAFPIFSRPLFAAGLVLGLAACHPAATEPDKSQDQAGPTGPTDAPALPAAGGAKPGAVLFLQCRACHTIGAGEANGVGPNLHDVFGAKAASHPGYSYSDALKASDILWDRANLDEFLTGPTKKVPGTRMTFAGIADPAQRKAVIDYLASLKAAQ